MTDIAKTTSITNCRNNKIDNKFLNQRGFWNNLYIIRL